jgi:hypothetical protein
MTRPIKASFPAVCCQLFCPAHHSDRICLIRGDYLGHVNHPVLQAAAQVPPKHPSAAHIVLIVSDKALELPGYRDMALVRGDYPGRGYQAYGGCLQAAAQVPSKWD